MKWAYITTNNGATEKTERQTTVCVFWFGVVCALVKHKKNCIFLNTSKLYTHKYQSVEYTVSCIVRWKLIQTAWRWNKAADLDIGYLQMWERIHSGQKILYVKKAGRQKLNSFTLSSFCNEMEFAPHPSYSKHSNLLGTFLCLSLSPSFIQGSLALTSYCSSEWHAVLPGIQFIWAMRDHKTVFFTTWTILTAGGGQERREKEGVIEPKQNSPPVKNPPLRCVWNVRGDSGLYLLVCLQIVTACAECSDRWAQRA